MCGIAGYIMLKPPRHGIASNFLDWFKKVCEPTLDRGPDAVGAVYELASGNLSRRAADLRMSPVSKEVALDIIAAVNMREPIVACSLNFRGIPTTEQFGDALLPNDQIQPFLVDGRSIAHNGLLSNDKALYAELEFDRMQKSGDHDIDSYTFLQLDRAGYSIREVDGSWALALIDHQRGYLTLSRTFLGLHLALVDWPDGARYLVWASEPIKPPYFEYGAVADCWEMPSYSRINRLDYKFKAIKPIIALATMPLYQASEQLQAMTWPLYSRSNDSVAVVLSGGLDSTVAITMACRQYKVVHPLHFLYGAKAEAKEVQAVNDIYEYFKKAGVMQKPVFIDLSYLKQLGGSTLTEDNQAVATGEEGIETIHEWVPARNTVMLAMAAAYCDRHKIDAIALGLNREESAVYNDNSSEFIAAMEKALDLGTQARPKLFMPLANMMKWHIYRWGRMDGAPIHLSWSCYNGYEQHCGQCGPCLMRKKACAMGGFDQDNIEYAA